MKDNCCKSCSSGTGGGSNCQDKDKDCAYFKGQGYCSSSKYGPWMKDNCCKSCQS